MIKKLVLRINGLKKPNIQKVSSYFLRIYDIGWNLYGISDIIDQIKSESELEKVLHALRTISDYQLKELHSNFNGDSNIKVSFILINLY